jgi:hypothetical protein
MSKRRKNAGLGYQFHGAFSEKKEAVKKEKQRKGSFIKGVPTQHGYRYIVMSPRTNPIKRKKKAAKMSAPPSVTPAPNPSELLVMGANPSKEQEIKIPLPGGGEVTIRTNPLPRTNSLGTFLGFAPSHPSKKELAESRRSFKAGVRRRVKENREYLAGLKRAARGSQKQTRTARVFHELYGKQEFDSKGLPVNPATCGAMIGGYPCTRKPGHRGPHLPQGATMRTRHRLPRNWQPKPNPSAEALREKFTGMRVQRVQVMDEPHMPAGDYAMLGKLLALYVKPRKGGQVQMIQAAGGTIVVSDETARQIYFVGGDQDISSGLDVFGALDRGDGLFELGEARRIDYKQRKEHVPDPDADAWRHSFGEESGVCPIALYDSRSKRLRLEGGEYVIRTEGIVN